MSASFLRRNFLCRFQLCQTFKQVDGDTHIWAECQVCGKEVGKVSREAIRRYMDAQERWERSRATPNPTPANGEADV